MQTTRKGLRLHIGIFGRRNVGKSSLLNAITQQNVSIVSEWAGTTTDPVEKPMELLPIGPVLFIDTAGIDDEGALGSLRIDKTQQTFNRVDLALLVVVQNIWTAFEEQIFQEMKQRSIPLVLIFNKVDIQAVSEEFKPRFLAEKIAVVETIAHQGKGILELKHAIVEATPTDYFQKVDLISDLVLPGELALLVVPIDKEAPKGRLITPQVQTIRDLLDNDSYCMVVKERELRFALDQLKRLPKLVITDSQAFLKVAGDVPATVPMTSFSILFSRLMGDLREMVHGAMKIDQLKSGDRILMAEACTHHPIGEDIGRVKIPRWLTQYVGGKLDFTVVQGHDFPTDLSPFQLVIHCGACMINRREMLSRIYHCQRSGVAITNYGLAIAYSLGIFKRALEPFPFVFESL